MDGSLGPPEVAFGFAVCGFAVCGFVVLGFSSGSWRRVSPLSPITMASVDGSRG